MKNLAILLILFFTTSVFAQEKYKLTPYQPKVGDTFEVADTAVENMNLTFNGMPIQQDAETTTIKYVEKVLDVKDGEIVKRERTYSECTQKSARGDKKYGFVGKTVVITGSGKTVKIECKDGSKLGYSDQSYLKRKFGKKNPMSGSESFYPKDAVAEGETWNISIEKFVKETDMPKNMFDQKTSTLKATLKKVYDKGGVKMGDIECRITFNVGKFPRLENAKGQFVMSIDITVCIDGSKNVMTMKGKGNFDVDGNVKSPQGEGKMVMKMKITGDKTVSPK